MSAGAKYGVIVSSTDVLARVLEVIGRAPLDEVLHQRLFRPLDMTDTAFIPAKQGRAARRPVLVRLHDRGGGAGWRFAGGRGSFRGGGPLSTLADYTRFAAMLSFGGSIDGSRILGLDFPFMTTTSARR